MAAGKGQRRRTRKRQAQLAVPATNWGKGTLRANPVPSTGLVNRVRVALRDWVTSDTPPPPSQWPTLKPIKASDGRDGDRDDDDDDRKGGDRDDHKEGKKPKWQPLLVEPTQAAMGFPAGVPGIPASIFLADNFVFPVLDYNWGPAVRP